MSTVILLFLLLMADVWVGAYYLEKKKENWADAPAFITGGFLVVLIIIKLISVVPPVPH